MEPNDHPISPNILIYHLLLINLITINLDFIVPPNKIYNIHKMYGGQPQQSQLYGGNGGHMNEFTHNYNLCLVGVRGRSGANLDQLQFLFRDITTGQFIESGRYGGNGGSAWIYQAPEGQWIDKVWVEYHGLACSLKFGTNAGMQSR